MERNERSNYNRISLYDRIKKLLVSYEWSDCNFNVSDTKLKAHKLILGTSSPVFEAMFYGPLSNTVDTNNIVITDIQPDIFKLVLYFIYTDDVEITCIKQAFELMYASRKYILEHLTEKCIAYIQINRTIDNVIEILSYPDYLQGEQLIKHSLKLFCEHADYLLEEKKNTITYTCMKAILESDQMNMEEKHLIKHVFEWSMNCCDQDNVPPTIENRRNALTSKGLFKLLRFLSLTLNDLEEITSDKANLLLSHEYEIIKNNIIRKPYSKDNEVVSVITKPRKRLQLQWYLCYRSPLWSIASIVIDSNNYIIQSRFKSNKSGFISTLCVPTRMAPAVHFSNNTSKEYAEQLSVLILSESDNSIVKFTNFMNTVEYDSVARIELTEPCFIKKDQWYKITFEWPQNGCPTYTYIVEYRDKKYTGHKVTFEFDDLPFRAGNIGSFLGGLKFCL